MSQSLTTTARAAAGLDVVEHTMGPDQQMQRRPLKLVLLLGGVFGDTPADRKLALWLGHAAYLGCGYCLLRGTYQNGMYFLGYSQPTEYGRFKPDERKGGDAPPDAAAPTAFCSDPVTHLPHAKQLARGLFIDRLQGTAAAKAETCSDLGCHGTSPIVSALWYVDYNNLFIVPIAHAGLLGLVKGFWSLLLAPRPGKKEEQEEKWWLVSPEHRRLMAERAAHLTPTCDFGRLYTDIISKKGNWTMEVGMQQQRRLGRACSLSTAAGTAAMCW
jgi:hypothetical protein